MSISVDEFRALVDKANKKSTKRMHGTPEHDTQVECVNWFREDFPVFADLLWAIPNGGYRSKATARAMKAEGQKAGVPDLQLAVPRKGYHGLFIEMKKSSVGKKGQLVGKGRTSELQDKMIERLREVGYKVEVCYSFEQFKNITREYLL